MVEKNQVHGSNSFIVFLKLGFKDLFKVIHSFDWKVGSFVAFTGSNVGGVEEWFSEYCFGLAQFSEFFKCIGHVNHELGLIFFEDKSIVPYSHALVSP